MVALERPARLIALAVELGAQGHEVTIHCSSPTRYSVERSAPLARTAPKTRHSWTRIAAETNAVYQRIV